MAAQWLVSKRPYWSSSVVVRAMWFVDLCLDREKNPMLCPNSYPTPLLHTAADSGVVRHPLRFYSDSWLMHDSWYFPSWKYTQKLKRAWFLHNSSGPKKNKSSCCSTGMHHGCAQKFSEHSANLCFVEGVPCITEGYSAARGLPHLQGGVDTPRVESGPTTFSVLASSLACVFLYILYHWLADFF